MDLVEMQNSPIENNGKTFKYVFVVLDVFSRLIFLRTLESKASTEDVSNFISYNSEPLCPLNFSYDSLPNLISKNVDNLVRDN